MSNTKVLKQRIRSAASTKQITKAMELVAASKLRRVQDAARASRAYSQIAYSILHRVSAATEVKQHYYFTAPKKMSHKLYVIFSSDRGLAGAFNSNLQSTTLKAIHADKQAGINTDVVVFGRRGGRFFAKLSDVSLKAVYDQIDDAPNPEVFAPLFNMIDEGVKSGTYQEVNLVYTEFKNTLLQEVKLR